MQTGDLVMFRGTGLIPWAIRLWTRSAFGHCGVLWVCDGVPLVLEARWPGGVTCHALANRETDRPLILETGRPLNLAYALNRLGDTYSTKDALRAGFGAPGDHAGWTCAEFAAELLGLGAGSWTPGAVARFFSS